MPATLIAYSRAGDVFHYRWAARRCLRLIYPAATVFKIQVEGSLDLGKEGEDVIDLTEYERIEGQNEKVSYYQLKHTTVQQDDPFTLSDLSDTFKGFAQKYLELKDQENAENTLNVSFTIITNRPIATSFKENLERLANSGDVDSRFKEAIEKYTGLTSDDLAVFCRHVSLQDSAGNYQVQQQSLRTELGQLMAGSVDNNILDSLVTMVAEQVLPDADGTITRERVLQRFKITSERELYPAPGVWGDFGPVFGRKQYKRLIDEIWQSSAPAIIHAAGGVGKSVFCRHFVTTLPEGSIAIAYDCFGAGSYRNRSETRHRHKDALIQIANELAAKGLCPPLLPVISPTEEDLMRKFVIAIQQVINSLQKVNPDARLFLLVDAADNAEMAAKEFGHSCFAHELLAESLPQSCHLIMLCRTERISLLQPKSNVTVYELSPFDYLETGENLHQWFPEASQDDVIEFHRLTAGNPRVQANACNSRHSSINSLLVSLGPAGTSVEDQIALQLQSSINKVKDALPQIDKAQTTGICIALASLPPNIPLKVLSAVANVDISHINSFVADLGRSLWLSDTAVRFRDEPTETWFRKTFLANLSDFEKYITALEPLGQQISYVAEVLPQLYLQAGRYDKLLQLALSDDFLPLDHPIDARNIRMRRLQFAFKAALKTKKYKDAVLIAMRAGEEAAGSERQQHLFRRNVDLLVALQSREKVQEIAFRRQLGGSWDGSENAYSASLLSGDSSYHGEARGYLRAAWQWLIIYYTDKQKDNNLGYRDAVSKQDVLEMAYAHYNLFGISSCVDFLQRFTRKRWIFEVVADLGRRLIDAGRFDIVDEFLEYCPNEAYFIVAIASELIRVGRFPPKSKVQHCLDLMCSQRSRIKPHETVFNDPLIPAILAFAEACLFWQLETRKIRRVLRHYFPTKPSVMVGNARYSTDRAIFLRGLAIKTVLSGQPFSDVKDLVPELQEEHKNDLDNEARLLKESIAGMFPWYHLRAWLLFDRKLPVMEVLKTTNETSLQARTNRYMRHDILPVEIASICGQLLVLNEHATPDEVTFIYQSYIQNNGALQIEEHLSLLRAAYRLPHLSGLLSDLEQKVYQRVKSSIGDDPDEHAGNYMALARSVIVTNPEDAGVYFNEGVEIVSKFGQEMVRRWEALVSLAERTGEEQQVSPELAYRFIRCAELVGEKVAREKHWDRGSAVMACSDLSPGTALAAISRWRDAAIDNDDYLFAAVFSRLLEKKVLTPIAAWNLNPLFSSGDKLRYLSACLEQTSAPLAQQKVFDEAVLRLRKEGARTKTWRELQQIGAKYAVNNEWLQSLHLSDTGQDQVAPLVTPIEDSAFWDSIFVGLDLCTAEGLQNAIERYQVKVEHNTAHLFQRQLLREALLRLSIAKLLEFVEAQFQLEQINRYDIQETLRDIPPAWKSRPSFQVVWPKVIRCLGEQFAEDFSHPYSFESTSRELSIAGPLLTQFTDGIFAGLANGDELADEEAFFGFVAIASSYLTLEDAAGALEYALSRFELHIAPDFGDGNWDKWLQVDQDINAGIARLLWTSLGAPQADVRWRAAHCVRKFAEEGECPVIDNLIQLLPTTQSDAFTRNSFIFYHMHARQYLLISLARVAIDGPAVLRKHAAVFQQFANSPNHVLIQKFAADIMVLLERSYPGSYGEPEMTRVKNAGISPFPAVKKTNTHKGKNIPSAPDEAEKNAQFHFDWDWEGYWFRPLIRIFGLTDSQFQALVADVIVQEWGMGGRDAYSADARANVWERLSNYGDVSYDHGKYPRVDRLYFYLCYHAMLVVAGRLLQTTPVIETSGYGSEDPWGEWLNRHLLTSADGLWISDKRDPLPDQRPEWTKEPFAETWQEDISDDNFIQCVKGSDNPGPYLTVYGDWKEVKDKWTETFAVSSALALTEDSKALAMALVQSKDRYDYHLPAYDESEIEIDSATYQAQGWIEEESASRGLDEYDPHANGVKYPPLGPGEDFITLFDLIPTDNGDAWKSTRSDLEVLRCSSWISYHNDPDKDPDQSGMSLKAHPELLKQICSDLNCDLVIVVAIRRDKPYRSGEYVYHPPKRRVFIFSANGDLTDMTAGQSSIR